MVFIILMLSMNYKYLKDILKMRISNSEMLSKYGISIPIDPNLTKKQISYVINKLNSF